MYRCVLSAFGVAELRCKTKVVPGVLYMNFSLDGKPDGRSDNYDFEPVHSGMRSD
ncbi:MAG: hypothetical protein HFG54_08065 [Lachnospiraceae bacterium]|jgi:hypothetical protein|nr:hypothetical protein [Lachnospiraceae bacterium]